MMESKNQTPAKVPCATCQLLRRLVLLALGFGVFVFFAYSREYLDNAQLIELLEYLTLENALYAMFVAIAAKLASGAVSKLIQK